MESERPQPDRPRTHPHARFFSQDPSLGPAPGPSREIADPDPEIEDLSPESADPGRLIDGPSRENADRSLEIAGPSLEIADRSRESVDPSPRSADPGLVIGDPDPSHRGTLRRRIAPGPDPGAG